MTKRPLTFALALAVVASTATVFPSARTARAAETSLVAAEAAAPVGLWQEVDVQAIATKQDDVAVSAQAYRVFELDHVVLANVLDRAPMEFSEAAKTGAACVITLPTPDGSLQRFRIEESSIMEPELAARFPAIRTFIAQ